MSLGSTTFRPSILPLFFLQQSLSFFTSSPLRIDSVDNPSYVWTSIIAAKKLLFLGIRNKVHSRYEIIMWKDP